MRQDTVRVRRNLAFLELAHRVVGFSANSPFIGSASSAGEKGITVNCPGFSAAPIRTLGAFELPRDVADEQVDGEQMTGVDQAWTAEESNPTGTGAPPRSSR